MQGTNEKSTEDVTHFGYKNVKKEAKASLVKGVFDSVTERYDIMNDLMSLGLHRLWKRYISQITNLKPGERALDLAAGTGDVSSLLAKQVGSTGEVLSTDINFSMLNQGRKQLEDKGQVGHLAYVVANAEDLPFDDNYFDCVTMAFGLRNVTDQMKALNAMYRVLRPGGKVIVLEFSRLKIRKLQKCYDAYSFHLLPQLGKAITGDEAAYRYLVESIRMHPDQETLKSMFVDAGFSMCRYRNIHGGVVAVHTACKA